MCAVISVCTHKPREFARISVVATSSEIREFAQRQRRRERERKKAKQQLCKCITLFVHFSAVVARLQRQNA